MPGSESGQNLKSLIYFYLSQVPKRTVSIMPIGNLAEHLCKKMRWHMLNVRCLQDPRTIKNFGEFYGLSKKDCRVQAMSI